MKDRSELFNAYPSGEVGVNMRDQAKRLPCREAAAPKVSLSPARSPSGARHRARFSLKKGDSMRDVRLCGFTITLTHSPRRLDKLCRYNGRLVRDQRAPALDRCGCLHFHLFAAFR
jgi:hypothetical protein